MVNSFLFDIGNVLLPLVYTRALQKLEPLCGIPIESVMLAAKPVYDACEAGQITREDFLRSVTEILKFSGTEEEFAAIWQDIFTENIAMAELVRTLQRQYPLYLLSNTSGIHVDYFTRVYPVFSHFSGAVYSHEAKCMKPAREIYEVAMQKFGITPNQTVFIDDLPANVQTARELGFIAIQYDFNRHGALLDALKAVGVNA